MLCLSTKLEKDLLDIEDLLSRSGSQAIYILDAGQNIPEPERRMQFYTTHGREAISQYLSFEETPVSVREFVESDKYLKRKGALWPLVMQELEELCSGKYDLAVLTGGIGVAKTTVAIYAVAYMLYQIAVLRSPHKLYDLIDTDEIVIAFQSLSLKLSTGVDFMRFKNLVDTAPWFLKNFHRNQDLSSEGHFPKNVVVKPLSGSSTAAIGQNLIGGFIDEVNFMQVIENSKQTVTGEGVYDQAREIYRAMMRRRESRFLRPGGTGQLPGILCLGSSKQYPGEFTEELVEQAREEERNLGYTRTFVYDKRRWEIKPEDYRNSKWFNVFVGDETRRPKILAYEETVPPEESHLVMAIPEDHRRAFNDDLLAALRDVAGVSTQALHPFIPHTDKIAAAFGKVPSVLTAEWCDFREHGIGIDTANITNPAEPRFVHIDLAKTSTPAGIACCYVERFVEIQRTETEVETWPVIRFDFILEIMPPPNDEIPYDKIRALLYKLRECGMNIRWATADTFQCVSGDARIVTARGLIRAADVVEGDIVQSRIGPRPVLKKWSFGKRPCLRIKTDDGHELTVTSKHKLEKLMVRNWPKHKWCWAQASDLKVGDVLHAWDRQSDMLAGNYIKLEHEPHAYNAIHYWQPPLFTEGVAEAIGLLWGDGDIQHDGIRLTVTPDEADDAQDILSKVFGADISNHPYTNGAKCRRLSLSSRALVRWLKRNGLIKSDQIPEIIWRSPLLVQAAFVRGLFSTDGSVDPRDGGCSYSTKHLAWAHYVQTVLRCGFGIGSNITRVDRALYDGYDTTSPYQYIVRVRGPRRQFFEAVGFCYQDKQAVLMKHLDRPGKRVLTKILSIDAVEAEVFDFEVDEDHAYVANGLISHNSVDMFQMLRQRGILAGTQSVDTDMRPYSFLKTGLEDGRILAPKHPSAQLELARLEWNAKKNVVDHPPKGKKDVSDAMAGAAFGVTMRMEVWARHKVRALLPKRLVVDAQKIEQKDEKRSQQMRDSNAA